MKSADIANEILAIQNAVLEAGKIVQRDALPPLVRDAVNKAQREIMQQVVSEAKAAAERDPEVLRMKAELEEKIRRHEEDNREYFAKYHLESPRTIEEWVHLAEVVGIPTTGKCEERLTADIIHRKAVAYVDRLRLQRAVAMEPAAMGDRLGESSDQQTVASLEMQTPETHEVGGDESKLDQLQRAHRKAYFSFLYAVGKLERTPEGLQDHEAWDYVNEHGIVGAGELDNYKLPLFDTYTDYLTRARKALGEQKKRPRTVRGGRSTLKQSET